jgi:cytochrome P450
MNAAIGSMLANRDPGRFPDPDWLDIMCSDNRHVAFGWAAHFCFDAPLARLEGQIVIESVLRPIPNLTPASGPLLGATTWDCGYLRRCRFLFEMGGPRA